MLSGCCFPARAGSGSKSPSPWLALECGTARSCSSAACSSSGLQPLIKALVGIGGGTAQLLRRCCRGRVREGCCARLAMLSRDVGSAHHVRRAHRTSEAAVRAGLLPRAWFEAWGASRHASRPEQLKGQASRHSASCRLESRWPSACSAAAAHSQCYWKTWAQFIWQVTELST